jgi:hemin uptake protein HemP
MAEPKPSPDAQSAGKQPHAAPAIDVNTLLCGRPEVRLVHRGVEYRLRVTRQGKLLLTK